MKAFRFLLIPVLTGLVVGLLLLLFNVRSPLPGGPDQPHATSYADAVTKAIPAVVNIYTTQMVARTDSSAPPQAFLPPNAEAPQRERILASLGSGVLVSPQGYLLTSHHVIRNADEILVALLDGREAVAQVVGTDPETDLALLKVDIEQAPYIEIDDDSTVRVGDVVLAIGNPLGMGQTVSMGIVGATGRSQLGITTFENFIQTDAAINQGNSGGALVDSAGHLVGINTAILSSDGNWQGIGFATPTSTAKAVMNDLIEHGRVIRGWLGVSVTNITPSMAGDFGLRDVRGGLIREVALQSPAHLAGIRPGDVLVGVNGRLLRDAYEGMQFITATRPGTELELNIVRQREEIAFKVVLGTRPPAAEGSR
ncbi:trypsin-like peptidase domain-containing protein [Isoalcanivorax beigongshangi]|uniref:Trypsin-like peptidase domain-containing protein n=1 Tax=Isoalcanivorax beigongshangi TaxID=3238810 RepID=A0ABV4AKS3_9GAMM